MRISTIGLWLLAAGAVQAQVRDTTTQIDEVVVRAEAPDAVVQARSTTLTTSIGRGSESSRRRGSARWDWLRR